MSGNENPMPEAGATHAPAGWLTEAEIEEAHAEVPRICAAYIRHHMRGDREALGAVVPAAIRNDLYAWLLVDCMAGWLEAGLRREFGEADAPKWADIMIAKFADQRWRQHPGP